MGAIVVNFYAGPGAGKSSCCAYTFSKLKWLGVNCEMALEYAKDKVWEESTALLSNQLYVFGKQQHRMYRLKDKVDVIITDAPLLNSVYYDAEGRSDFREVIISEYARYFNLDFFVKRSKPYNSKGRLQTEEEAKKIDEGIISILDLYTDRSYKIIEGTSHILDTVVVPFILQKLNNR